MTYELLLAQRAELDKQIADARASERSAAVTAVRNVIAKFDLTVKDVFNATRKPSTSKGKKAPVKYADHETGKTWSGRGVRPTWLKDKELSDYAVA